VAGGYHGETIGALGVTDVALFRDAYDPLIRGAHVVASPDARSAEPGESAAQVAARALEHVRKLFDARASHIAALIVEPLVQCASGMAMHDASYIAGLRKLCDAYDVHLIADEIAVGCGRTGTFFACEQAHVWPDFLCLSKGISGGYLPLSLVLSCDEIYAAFYDDDTTRGFLHSHSYTGNPLACRAALATLDLIERGDVLASNERKSAALIEALGPVREHERVRHFRRRGTIVAFDVVLDSHAASAFSRRFFEQALSRELLLRPIGKTVYLMPPYILDSETIALLGSRTLATLEATLSDGAC
ncbi:MAG: aminotransferase class III-fold pyridoxal phosphate-dependent enzyme, partial [Burkholderiales bacterium]|nr:aminotransferase class III-fold pyridoxal phosphate-dependent enzyme [Burkholderiales bacterium]